MIKYVWLLLSLSCIGWYLVVLGFVAIKGGADIKEMLKKLSASDSADDSAQQRFLTRIFRNRQGIWRRIQCF